VKKVSVLNVVFLDGGKGKSVKDVPAEMERKGDGRKMCLSRRHRS